MISGVGLVFNLTKDFRTLLEIQPLTIPLYRTIPLVYKITMIKNRNSLVFSNSFVTDGEFLSLERIKSNANETTIYGPNFSSTEAYHADTPFLLGDAEYTIVVEYVSINSKVPESVLKEKFPFKTVT